MNTKATNIETQTRNGNYEIVLTLPHDSIKQVESWLPQAKKWLADGKALACELDLFRAKRSLNANNYSYALSDKIADVLRADKDVVHFDLLKRYGQKTVVSVVKEGVDILTSSVKYWESGGETELNGKTFYHYKIYKPSSDMNSKEMAIYIDGIVSECKLLDIETMLPDEIERLKASWGKEKI